MHEHNYEIDNLIRNKNEKYNDDFIKRIGCDDLNIGAEDLHGSEWSKNGFNGFQTVWLKNIDRLMQFLIDSQIKVKDHTLLDLGNGNGISTFYFGEKYNFSKIIGIEINENLHNIAKENLKKRNQFINDTESLNIEFFNINALNFEIPDEKFIIFIFNTLQWHALEVFIKNNLKNLRKNKCILLQANDHCINEVLNYSKLIKRNDFFNISAVIF